MKIAATTPAPAAQDPAKLKKAAQGFEAVFLRQMIGSMRSATLTDDDIFGSSAADQFRDMGDARLADDMAKKGGFGIAELLTRQFGAQGLGTDRHSASATRNPPPPGAGGAEGDGGGGRRPIPTPPTTTPAPSVTPTRDASPWRGRIYRMPIHPDPKGAASDAVESGT